MQNFIIPVNNEALSRALVAVAGEETAALICKAYKAIDEAMQFGHAQGVSEEQAKRADYEAGLSRHQQEQLDLAYASGRRQGDEDQWEAGYQKGLDDANDAQDAFDEGYAEGVHDARVRPEMADDYLGLLVGKETELLDEDFDGGSPWAEDAELIEDFDEYGLKDTF